MTSVVSIHLFGLWKQSAQPAETAGLSAVAYTLLLAGLPEGLGPMANNYQFACPWTDDQLDWLMVGVNKEPTERQVVPVAAPCAHQLCHRVNCFSVQKSTIASVTILRLVA
ncbi:hypothetical protein AB6A40_007938 [Gnathostoma spinigerum]|uniref:Uncharacterized protein n=1 Tax=Gnathostoma spinigerum TaxID=75299 RepID=A0ABD6EVE4_9BILA